MPDLEELDDNHDDIMLPDMEELERLFHLSNELGKTLENNVEENAFLFWLEKPGFVMNDDNSCMNRMINGKTMYYVLACE